MYCSSMQRERKPDSSPDNCSAPDNGHGSTRSQADGSAGLQKAARRRRILGRRGLRLHERPNDKITTLPRQRKLYAKPGQKSHLSASTGAGKTTITKNLINRFYDIQGTARSRYDGININKIRADLRRSLGIVLQDAHVSLPER
ncbi:MAG: hypothetical protein ACLTSZ_09525 [Lachnospiraceae bacterium]